MNRLFSAIFALIVLLCLCACSPGEPETSANTAPPTTTAPKQTQPDREDPQLGSFADGVYTNDFLGIRCEIGDGWSVYSDAQLAQLNGLLLDTMTDAELVEQLKKSNVAHLFYATADNGYKSMNVVLENIGVVNGVLLDEKSYMALSVEQLPTALQSMGLSNVTVEAATVHFAGADRAGVRVHGVLSGVDFYEKIVCIKVESYFGLVTVASYQEDITDTLLTMFTEK